MDTQIICRLNKTNRNDTESGKLQVFLKTSDQATCQPNNVCDWTVTANIPEVINIITRFHDTLKKYYVVITGTGFTGSPETTELLVAGIPQKTIILDSSEAVFEV